MTTAAAAWRSVLTGELRAAGLPDPTVTQLADDADAEAAAAGQHPAELFGPATAYAAALARAVRASEPARTGYPASGRSQDAAPGPVRLAVREVTKRYRRRQVLAPVTFTLRGGQVAAVVGANGSGKSTLLDICAGAVRPSSGSVERGGRLGYVPQYDGLAPLLTVGEHLALFGAAAGIRPRRALTLGGGIAAELGWRPDPKVRVGTLSGGTQQKLNVILGVLDRPDLILLDEPYQGFDEHSYLDFWELIFAWRDAGAAILVVSHLQSSLRDVDLVVELTTPEA